MRCLIDGDLIVYAAGFFNDITYYTVDGAGHHKYKKDAKVVAKKRGVDPSLIVKHHEPNDKQKSLDGVDWMITNIFKSCDSDDGVVYITGSGNFRNEVAVTHKYKGNRDASNRPFWFDDMREFIVDKWGGELVEGEEADDAMGIEQCESPEDSTIICSLDKDMLMIPGQHYNWKKDVFCTVSEDEGLRHFFKQLLTGDRTDNIMGIKGVGDKTADKMMKGVFTYALMTRVIKPAYKREFGHAGNERLQENADLLWIRRSEGDRYLIGSVP
jgi:hypothetical protein